MALITSLISCWRYCKGMLIEKPEKNGIERYGAEERQTQPRPTTLAVTEFWFALNLSTLNMTAGMLGPRYFALPLHAAFIVAVIAITTASIPVGLVASMGPKSGLRTTTINRFVVGWYPAKLVSFVQVFMIMGYNTLDIIAAGNLLSALIGEAPLASTLAVVSLGASAVFIAVMGGRVLHFFERWAWWPQLLVLAMMTGIAVPQLVSARSGEKVSSGSNNFGAHLGFFGIVFASVITYSSIAADFFVHYPEDTPTRVMTGGTFGGLWLAYTLSIGLGIVVAAGANDNLSWNEAYNRSPAELLVEVNAPLGGLGKVNVVCLAIGNLAAAAAGTYSLPLAVQNISAALARVPRTVCTAVTGGLVVLCAAAGKDSFVVYLQSFVTTVGCFTAVWLAVFGTEILLHGRRGYAWAKWNEKRSMPAGWAATLSQCVGCTMAVLSMAQPWYIGPIAMLAGKSGVDVCLPHALKGVLELR